MKMWSLVALALASEPAQRAEAPVPTDLVPAPCVNGQLCDGRCIPWSAPCAPPLLPLPPPPLPGLPDAFATCGAEDPQPSSAAVMATFMLAGAMCGTSSDPTCKERASAPPPAPPTAPSCSASPPANASPPPSAEPPAQGRR